MKISFVFNSVNRVILIPENGKDKQLLSLCCNGARVLTIVPSADDSIIVEFREDSRHEGRETQEGSS